VEERQHLVSPDLFVVPCALQAPQMLQVAEELAGIAKSEGVSPRHTVSAHDEWSPLRSVIVGRAGRACFPYGDTDVIRATMPAGYLTCFKPASPFPPEIVARAEVELNLLAQLLEQRRIRVYRPSYVDWLQHGGYTGAMPRDGLMTVGHCLVEAPFAWGCRKHEIQLAFGDILTTLAKGQSTEVLRRPANLYKTSLYDSDGRKYDLDESKPFSWIINDARPAFDAADFMRFGKVIIGQYSHVTNAAGVAYLRQHIPKGYSVELLEVHDPGAMHIDATILPLRQGLLVYHPEKVTEASLRKHKVLSDWELHAYPFEPKPPHYPPLFMTSPWLSLNALVLDGVHVVVEQEDTQTAKWFSSLGMKPILCPFRHVNSIGGSFHCATVDLIRDSGSYAEIIVSLEGRRQHHRTNECGQGRF
jgi:glycine amidinotransferase